MRKYLITFCLILPTAGCMDAAIRFWNNGIPISKEEAKASHYCKENTNMSEKYDEYYQCLKKKGY